jgi:lysophospholipase L1-like esterase
VTTASGPRTVAPQIGAVGPDTKLVTLTVGGNDVSYIGNLMAESCRADLAANPDSALGNQMASYGLCAPVPDRAVATAFRTLEPSMESTIRAVQAKAPHARVVVVEYPQVVPADAQPCAVLPIPHARLEHYRGVAAGLQVATDLAAARTGATLVPAATLSRGHDACSSDPWITGYTSGVMNIMHPNAEGHVAVANAVVRELERQPLRAH